VAAVASYLAKLSADKRDRLLRATEDDTTVPRRPRFGPRGTTAVR
jgi:hypothetical protein